MKWEIEQFDHDKDKITFAYVFSLEEQRLVEFEKEFILPILASANRIEVKMGEIISYYYFYRDHEKAIEMQSNILPNTSYYSKVSELKKILAKHYPKVEFIFENWTQHLVEKAKDLKGDIIVNTIIEKLYKIRELRNTITHRMIDYDYTHYKKDGYVRLIYCDNDPAPVKYSEETLMTKELMQFEMFVFLDSFLKEYLAIDDPSVFHI